VVSRKGVVWNRFLSARALPVAPSGAGPLPCEVCQRLANAPVWDRLKGQGQQGGGGSEWLRDGGSRFGEAGVSTGRNKKHAIQ